MIFVTGLLVIAAVGLFAIRRYFKGPQFTEKVSAKGKVAIVTGANSGIGKMLVRELNLRGAKVYLFCRSEEKARNAVKDLFSMVWF